MFQVFFIENIGRKQDKSFKDLLNEYNCFYGHPPPGVAQKLCLECKKIQQVNNWDQFYKRIGLETPSPQQMTEILRSAVRNSDVKGMRNSRIHKKLIIFRFSIGSGYHINRMEYEHLFNLRKSRDPDLQVRGFFFFLRLQSIPTTQNFNTRTKITIKIKTLRYLTNPDFQMNPISQQHQISQEIKKLFALEEQMRNKPRISRPSKLVLTNLSFRMEESDIEQAFRQFGKIVAVDLHRDSETKRSKGIAVISCESDLMASAIIESMNHAELDGRKVNIKRPLSKHSVQHPRIVAPAPLNHGRQSYNDNNRNNLDSQKQPQRTKLEAQTQNSSFVSIRHSAPARKSVPKKSPTLQKSNRFELLSTDEN